MQTQAEDVKNLSSSLQGFRVYQERNSLKGLSEYSRRDYYKICLLAGTSTIHYADKSIFVEGYTLFFATPNIHYSWMVESKVNHSYSCLFTEEFFDNNESLQSLQESPFFKIGGTPVFKLDEKSYTYIKFVLIKMLEEQSSLYKYKDELIRSYLNMIIHEMHKQ